MDLDFVYQKVQVLSPKAAKIALRMLDKDPHIPTEWVIALRPALSQRASGSEDFRSTDWMTMVAIESPGIRRFTERFESREQRHARLWVMSLRKAARAAFNLSVLPGDADPDPSQAPG
ncbi:hypothetical protein QTH91_14655 [Variovorax dokdonensis]|uniref:Uncharacterized protein n=1 Tax=Variovorax dokdonensis TaxID=344883 RepID=A0ABT7NCS4_9BURK|nr:hypothetical protein [Variovorax dokdonensis]MDM0045728.1 hypothetical protein [Variovorax dokdonensis]